MKTHLECIPCFLRQTVEAARMTSDNEELHEEMLKDVMMYLQTISFQNSPPEISRVVHDIIRKKSGSNDPYKMVKDQSNNTAKKLYPSLKKMVHESSDPLLAAVKIAIVGNVIDFGTSNRFNIEEMLEKAVQKDFADTVYAHFKKRLDQAKTILYLADNAGEIFFDKVLLEELHKQKKEIVYVVKANPIINDATIDDAYVAGIDALANIIEGDKGQSRSTPGILLRYASEEFKQLFNDADMVISKGQGNYESLNKSPREIFFLLTVKCPLVAADMGVEMARLVLEVRG